MILAVLEFGDYLIMGVMIFALTAATRSSGSAAREERLSRIEDKLNFLMEHMGAEYVPKEKERWQRLADDNDLENAAKDYCETHSVLNEEATRVVEQYIADARNRSEPAT